MSVHLLVLLTLVLTIEGAPVLIAGALQHGTAASWMPTLPKRRTIETPSSEPPPLPAGADAIAPATLRMIVRRERDGQPAQIARQTVSRTRDRVHVTRDDRREWLFEQNPVDPRRVSAAMIDHESRTIVLYEESDLRLMLGVRGWVDVLPLATAFSIQNADGRVRTEIERSDDGVNDSLITPAQLRFPDYRLMAVAEWLEKH